MRGVFSNGANTEAVLFKDKPITAGIHCTMDFVLLYLANYSTVGGIVGAGWWNEEMELVNIFISGRGHGLRRNLEKN